MVTALQNVRDDEFAAAVLQAEIPVLVDFWATWCEPCKTMVKHLLAVAEALDGRVKVVKVELEEGPEVVGRYGVRSVPTLILFSKGQEVDRLVGNPGSKRPIFGLCELALPPGGEAA